MYYAPTVKSLSKMPSFFSSLLVFFFAALILAPQGLAYYYNYKPPIFHKPPHKKPTILNKKAYSSCTRNPTRPCYPPRRPPTAEEHNIHF
jgi:hypothetical protein